MPGNGYFCKTYTNAITMMKTIHAAVAALALWGTAAQATAQAVIFPQEAQPGTARATQTGKQYTLGNDLFEATWTDGGTLTFDGCPALRLGAGDDLFRIVLGDGTVLRSGDMTVSGIALTPLKADPAAARASEQIPGQALTATFSKDALTVTWSAELRDGSHYLRTSMDVAASRNQAMTALYPMVYNLELPDGEDAPAVVGDTRGAILCSATVFAGLETPMGINTVGQGFSDSGTFDPNAWTPESFGWQPGADTPSGILSLGFTAAQICGAKGDVEFASAGKCDVEFLYKSGNHRLNIAGVDITDASGKVLSSDYHTGYTGNLKSNNVYTVTVPEAGVYTLRLFMETRTETITSSGVINYSTGVKVANTGADNLMLGKWSRQTTLKKGETWNVSTVVGLVAPGQARRSVLAYNERERAVPWRAFPHYNSWYELNIDRNNAAPPAYAGNMTVGQCTDVVAQWREHLYDAYGQNIECFVWDDGWDEYGTWTFNPGFPNGFAEPDAAARAMNTGIGAWLGPVGGYGASGNYRRSYWNGKGGMQLSNPAYYKVFLDACTNLVNDYDFRFFKFDGISAQWSAKGPDAGAVGDENAEGILGLERAVRAIKPDIFLNTTVGTWASPFWFRFSDAVWRQENDHGTIGNGANDREKWITYRDRLVYQNFVTLSPLCPINTLMTHGMILTRKGNVSKDMSYPSIVNEMRCAFACGSGMVELYCDAELMNTIEGGKLWQDLAECIAWQRASADVLPDIHWVGGSPWDGAHENVYGWAAWNGSKAVLTLRNGATGSRSITLTLRQALDIPDYVKGSVILTNAFEGQKELSLPVGEPIDIDKEFKIRVPATTVVVYNGVDADGAVLVPEADSSSRTGIYDMSGRSLGATPTAPGVYVIDGAKRVIR